jgi:Niemann-Pick C1 protein
LSLVGGTGYVDPESEGGLEQDLRSRQYPALLGDDEDEDEDEGYSHGGWDGRRVGGLR